MLASIIYNYGKFYDDFKSTLKLGAYAVAEVYAGMHVRNATADNCIPVVFSTSDASEETRLYAKQLGVELILPHEMSMIIQAKKTGKV